MGTVTFVDDGGNIVGQRDVPGVPDMVRNQSADAAFSADQTDPREFGLSGPPSLHGFAQQNAPAPPSLHGFAQQNAPAPPPPVARPDGFGGSVPLPAPRLNGDGSGAGLDAGPVDELGTANLGSALIPGSPAAGGQIVQEAAQQAAPERSTFDRILDAARVVSESNVFGDIASGFNPQGGQNTGFGAGLARAGQLMAATRGRRSARAVAEQEALAKAQTAAARQQAAQTAAAKEARAASAAKSPAGKVMDDFNAGLIDEQTRDQQLQKFQDPTFVRKMESIDEREASGEIDAAEAIELRNKAIASGGTTVSVGTEGETAREKKQGQLIAQSQFDNMQSIQESGRTAGTQLRKLDTMESLLLAKQTEGEKGGFGTEAITTISGMLRGPLGLPDTVVDRLLSKEGQTRNEMIRSISKEMAIAQHTSGLGPMSDKDLAAFEAIVPGLDKSTEGSLQILNLMRTAAKAQQRNAVFLREWQSRPENRNKLPGPQFEAELEEFRDNNRLFVNDKSENVGALAKAGKIHPGTVIMDTSGNLVTLTEDHIKTLRALP